MQIVMAAETNYNRSQALTNTDRHSATAPEMRVRNIDDIAFAERFHSQTRVHCEIACRLIIQ